MLPPMIITCPACATRYVGDPAALGGGRMVRCAKCGHSWLQLPPADMPKQVDIPPEPPARRPGLTAPSRPVSAVSGGAALALAGVALAAALGIGYVTRESIVAAWPGARLVYDLLGIRATPLGAGLELGNVTFVLRTVEDEPVMTVAGEVANKTAEPRLLPALKATLRNDRNQWLADWVFRLDRAAIEPGETLRFETATKNPPEDAKRLSITFADEEG
jgi:predicted Zn finger-like uncharacterized protein